MPSFSEAGAAGVAENVCQEYTVGVQQRQHGATAERVRAGEELQAISRQPQQAAPILPLRPLDRGGDHPHPPPLPEHKDARPRAGDQDQRRDIDLHQGVDGHAEGGLAEEAQL